MTSIFIAHNFLEYDDSNQLIKLLEEAFPDLETDQSVILHGNYEQIQAALEYKIRDCDVLVAFGPINSTSRELFVQEVGIAKAFDVPIIAFSKGGTKLPDIVVSQAQALVKNEEELIDQINSLILDQVQ